ncbi:hypothetical protein ACOSQ4_023095 [Xanthoceras sorbifolium]
MSLNQPQIVPRHESNENQTRPKRRSRVLLQFNPCLSVGRELWCRPSPSRRLTGMVPRRRCRGTPTFLRFAWISHGLRSFCIRPTSRSRSAIILRSMGFESLDRGLIDRRQHGLLPSPF